MAMGLISNLFGANLFSTDLWIDHKEGRNPIVLPGEKGASTKIPVFSDGEDVTGAACLVIKPGKKLEHTGIKVDLVGQITLQSDRSPYEFVSISKDLEPPGSLQQSKQYPFKFTAVDKPYESYVGANAKVRYFVRLTVSRAFGGTVSHEMDFAVRNITRDSEDEQQVAHLKTASQGIRMEVGIEDCLHIEFEYDKATYDAKGVVVGRVYFFLVRIRIKYMEVCLVKREICGSGNNVVMENETVAKYEVMDGAPVKNECIPVRLYLSPYDLCPSYKNVLGRFSVKYFLNLVLVDSEDRRYFKQHEIGIARRVAF